MAGRTSEEPKTETQRFGADKDFNTIFVRS